LLTQGLFAGAAFISLRCGQCRRSCLFKFTNSRIHEM